MNVLSNCLDFLAKKVGKFVAYLTGKPVSWAHPADAPGGGCFNLQP